MECQRCLTGKEAKYRVHTDIIDMKVCEVCADEARKLGIAVEVLDDGKKNRGDVPRKPHHLHISVSAHDLSEIRGKKATEMAICDPKMCTHGYCELDIIPAGSSMLSLVISDYRQSRIARGVIFIVALVLLSGSFAMYRHFSTGVAKYITYDHALRRVLGRAERDNLRRGLVVKEQGPMAERPQQIGEVPPSPQLVATDYRISFLQHSLIDANRVVHNLSRVLNL